MRRDDTQQIIRDQTQELPRTTAIKQTRRIVLALVGTALILTGLALIVFPGPWTIPLVIAGLTVLSWEFRWAKRALFQIKHRIKQWRQGRRKR